MKPIVERDDFWSDFLNGIFLRPVYRDSKLASRSDPVDTGSAAQSPENDSLQMSSEGDLVTQSMAGFDKGKDVPAAGEATSQAVPEGLRRGVAKIPSSKTSAIKSNDFWEVDAVKKYAENIERGYIDRFVMKKVGIKGITLNPKSPKLTVDEATRMIREGVILPKEKYIVTGQSVRETLDAKLKASEGSPRQPGDDVK